MATKDIPFILDAAKNLDERRVLVEIVKKDLSPVKSKVRRVNGGSRIGKKLITAGLVLTLGTPDPFTDIVGWPLLAVGVVADRVYSHTGIKDIYREANRLMRELPDLKNI
ncbi:MAG: hypothetical protein HY619_01075 [Thaumarchaeota archaeon]|nr:hypothetical protein [Nitrososphaerota archaeon]